MDSDKKELNGVKGEVISTEKTSDVKNKKSIEDTNKSDRTIELVNDLDVEKSIIILDKTVFDLDVVYGVTQIKSGDSNFLKEVGYILLKDMVLMLNENARNNKSLVIDELGRNPYLKLKTLKSFIGGLYNKDPRVRLTSVIAIKHLLRSLKDVKVPKKSKRGISLNEGVRDGLKKKYKDIYIKTINILAVNTNRAWLVETVNKRKYLCIAINGKLVLANVYNEINDLDLFIVRELSLAKLNVGTLKPEDFTHTRLRVIRSLTKKLSNEPDYSVPVNSDLLLEDRVDILINSLGNTNKKVKRLAASHLLAMYYKKTTDNQAKNKIEFARKNNIFLDNMFKKYILEKQRKYTQK
jgi:hypothetical protein